MDIPNTISIIMVSLAAIALIGVLFYFLVVIPSPELVDAEFISNESPIDFQVETRNNSQSILDQFDESKLTQKIQNLLIFEKIYLQQGLTVGEFALRLGVQTRIVTRIFDKLYGHTFKELINMYRVEYAKERIEEGFLDHYTLEALGYESGFNSRTTFFNVFKKEIGTCPSDYWKSYLEEVG